MSVIYSMPAAWCLLIRTANIAPELSPLPNTPAIFINYILISILDASSKHIYRSFLAKKQTTPTAKDRGKLSAKYHHLTIDWKRVYLLSFRTTLETKLREFQFKITVNRYIVLIWLNQRNVPCAKLRSNPSSIYFFLQNILCFLGT